MANIDLFVCVTGKTSQFAEFTKKISSKLLSGKHKINWKYIISGKVKAIPKGYEYACTVKSGSCPSMSHGKALNKACSLAVENYVIMLDTDFVFLKKGWDNIIISNLDKGIAAFGVDSPCQVNRARNFPFIYCFCYRPDLLKEVNLDFRPQINKKGDNLRFDKVGSKREKDVMGLSFGSRYRWETSSRIPFLFYDNNLKSKSIECVLGDSENVKLPFLSDKYKKEYLNSLKKSKKNMESMQEWHYEKELFATHFRGAFTDSFEGKKSQEWVKRINLYLEK